MGIGPRFSPAKFSAVAAPVERPLPLWILYPLFFVVVYVAHGKLLRLPWFWDEAGYYIPAALDFFRTGSLIPHSTLTNAHPPLPSVALAAWWRVSGYVISGTRTFLCMWAAAALLGVFRLCRLLAGNAVAATVTALTAMYPVWFAQSSMAHADLFAATFTLWALSFALERYSPAHQAGPRTQVLVAVLFSMAALSKETAIVTPLVLGVWEAVLLLTEGKRKDSGASFAWVLTFFAPLVPLVCWYVFHFHKTGFVFGNPEFLRYNATANLSPLRVLISFGHRLSHLGLHMGMYAPVFATVAVLLMPRLPDRALPVLRKPALTAVGIVVAGNVFAFSVLGGALLTRYLLPLYPLVLLVCVACWQQRMRRWWALGLLSGAAFLVGLFVNPPYGFAPEDNLTYRDFVVLHQAAIQVIAQRFPAATVLTAWPGVAELEHPDLGYTRRPFKTVAIENFSLTEIEKAAADPGAYDTAMVFSTKWVPAPGLWNVGRANEETDTRFYDFHRDLSPHEIATMLHGEVVWQGARHGEWAAVIHFPRVVDASLMAPSTRLGR